ncbi:hypothetical protein M405DRAFT_824896 [Rhizopogon salebrosus TDB-379]|nr:hypothetical protein M405DRAFT_824896 [Rhizopogon salebrosus TDB-379]
MIGNKVDVAVKVLRILPRDEGSKKVSCIQLAFFTGSITSRDVAARHALETLEREGLTISRFSTAKTFPYRSSHTKERPPGSTLSHPDQSICVTNAIPTLFEARPRVMFSLGAHHLHPLGMPSCTLMTWRTVKGEFLPRIVLRTQRR